MKVIVIITFVLLLLNIKTYAGDINLTLIIEQCEKSKDSHSELEVFELNDNEINYRIKYSGRKNPSNIDSEKKCTLNDEQVKTAIDLIKEKSLNINDSVIIKNGSLGNFVTLSLKLNLGGTKSHLYEYGEINEIAESDYYYRILKIYDLLKQFLNDC